MQAFSPGCEQKESPDDKFIQGVREGIASFRIFFHPDCTVGFGIAPNHALRLVGFTTGRELHPALKTCHVFIIANATSHVKLAKKDSRDFRLNGFMLHYPMLKCDPGR